MKLHKNLLRVTALPIVLWLMLISCQDQGNFVFSQPYSHDFDVDAVFRKVAVAGIHPSDGWYKKYCTECHPPGSMVVQPAEVAPVLIIRIETADPRLEQIGFVRTQYPSTGFCNYTVTRYAFRK